MSDNMLASESCSALVGEISNLIIKSENRVRGIYGLAATEE